MFAQTRQHPTRHLQKDEASKWNRVFVRHNGVKAHLIDLSYLSLALTFLFSSSTAATFTPADLVTRLSSTKADSSTDIQEVNSVPNRKTVSNFRHDASICQNSTKSPLHNISSYYHTPWLDRSFCSYPANNPEIDLYSSEPKKGQSIIKSTTYSPAEENSTQSGTIQDCLPSHPSTLDRLLFQCEITPGKRSRLTFQNLRLEFCSDYAVEKVLDGYDACVMKGQKEECQQCLRSIYQMDQHVKFVYCHFARDILGRFDCETPFSVKWNCTHCQTAYRQWLCAMMIPVRMDEYLIKPCRTFCTMVEQRCPYLTPDDRVIIAGEPMFLCKDPDIPELYSAYDEPPHCYQPCHLQADLEPAEACLHHELLKEQLAIYYNMSKHPVSSSTALKLFRLSIFFSVYLSRILLMKNV